MLRLNSKLRMLGLPLTLSFQATDCSGSLVTLTRVFPGNRLLWYSHLHSMGETSLYKKCPVFTNLGLFAIKVELMLRDGHRPNTFRQLRR